MPAEEWVRRSSRSQQFGINYNNEQSYDDDPGESVENSADEDRSVDEEPDDDDRDFIDDDEDDGASITNKLTNNCEHIVSSTILSVNMGGRLLLLCSSLINFFTTYISTRYGKTKTR